MKLTYNEDEERYEMVGAEYHERAHMKHAGFHWDPHATIWYTKDPETAVKLVEYADEEAWERLDDEIGLQ